MDNTMLIRFNVKNFLSFNQKKDGSAEEFSMISGKVRNKKEHTFNDGKIKLLKFAAVYGANAAGKSNLVKAIHFMHRSIVSGIPNGYTEKYCKIDSENKERPSYFEVEIKIDDKYYAYGFEIVLNQSRYTAEWLIELHDDNTEKVIFARDIDSGEYEFGSELKNNEVYKKLSVYADDVKEDSSILFLSLMNQNKKNLYQDYQAAKIIRNIYIWFKDKLDISYPNQPISDYSYLSQTDNVDEVCKLISAFGTGIENFQMIEVPIESVLSKLPKELQMGLLERLERVQVEIRDDPHLESVNIAMRSNTDFFILTVNADQDIQCRTIVFGHGQENVQYRLAEESDGTVRILDLLEILIAGEGKTYVIDELDRCLHPSMTYKFVETFLEMAADKNIQLIVTTHESRLLDFDLLRRDEIWFINKRDSGESDIYSLEEYNARFDQKIDKAYLEGRYGGVPIFSTVFPVKEE